MPRGCCDGGKDFPTFDDASVRKLAALPRPKLKVYNTGDGATDEVVVSLPARSYVPLFQVRPSREPVLAMVAEQVPLIALATLGGAGAVVWQRQPSRAEPQIVFLTQGGDIMHRENSLPADAPRLRPALSLDNQVTVRMRFTPERATQQSGMLVYADADNYAKLGRQFNSRTQPEFGAEVAGQNRKPKGTFVYDPSGQSGEPIGLSIRRQQARFTAFISRDGVEWKRLGNEIEMPGTLSTRVALYAQNGRTGAPIDVRGFRSFEHRHGFP